MDLSFGSGVIVGMCIVTMVVGVVNALWGIK